MNTVAKSVIENESGTAEQPAQWRWTRALTVVFLCAVLALIIWQSQRVNWHEVIAAVRGYKGRPLTVALAFSALSYAAYSCFDLLGRHYVGARLRTTHAIRVAFISYAFNQSFGALLGAIAFRLRMYLRHGLDATQISKIIMLSIVTNWLGYAVLAGAVFAFGWIAMPDGWDTRQNILQLLGVVFLATAVAYFVLCAAYADREIGYKRWRLTVPHLPLASLQLLLSALHWPLTAAILYVLFDQRIDFMTVLGALFLNAVAVVITHIPAGLGVMEAIFIGLLNGRIPTSEIVGCLMVYRAVYYLVPLALATGLYLKTEATAVAHKD